jgi:hypothetical protein
MQVQLFSDLESMGLPMNLRQVADAPKRYGDGAPQDSK